MNCIVNNSAEFIRQQGDVPIFKKGVDIKLISHIDTQLQFFMKAYSGNKISVSTLLH